MHAGRRAYVGSMKRVFYVVSVFLIALATGCAPVLETFGHGSAAERAVPILMYHSILRDPARAGKYILSPETFEQDLVWLLSHGYETVTGRDLLLFVQGAADLPEKPVMLTFDDGYLNNLTYVLPLLQKYRCKAVISIVGAYTERYTAAPDPNPNYAYLSWADVSTLFSSGLVELGNHTFDLHGQEGRKGCARRRGESESAYADLLYRDVSRVQDALARETGVAPVTFAYPFGVVDSAGDAVLSGIGLCVTLTCREQTARVCCGKMDSLLQLGRYNRASGADTETFMTRVLGESG